MTNKKSNNTDTHTLIFNVAVVTILLVVILVYFTYIQTKDLLSSTLDTSQVILSADEKDIVDKDITDDIQSGNNREIAGVEYAFINGILQHRHYADSKIIVPLGLRHSHASRPEIHTHLPANHVYGGWSTDDDYAHTI